MECTKENFRDMFTKRIKYMDTAVKVFEKNTDENGDFKNQAAEIDFNRLLNKINDTADAIKTMAKTIAPNDTTYDEIANWITGIEGLKTAMEIEDKIPATPLMRPRGMIGDYGSDVESKGACLTIESKKYRNMFCSENRHGGLSTGGFRNFNDYLKTLHSGRFDERLKNMVEGIPSEGGFAVPEEFAAFLIDNSLEAEIVRPRAQVWPMKSETRKIPAWDGFDHTSNLFGGLSGVWLGEGQTAQRQNGKLRLMTFNAHKLACFSQASNELIADGLSFEDQLGQAMISSTSWSMDYAFLCGNGVAKPLGVLNDPALITVSKEAGQAAGTIVYENLIKMFSRLAPQCVKNAVWIANSTTIPGLLTLTISVGTAGSAIPVMNESNGQFTILTRPVIFTEKVPSLGNKGDILLVDLTQYAVGLRKDILIDKSNAPGWTEDMTDYRTILRVDGRGIWREPITPKNGDTISWCVTLENRA